MENKDLYPLALAVAAKLCKSFEGTFLYPYLCPAGIPTIGIGATYYENGIRVTLKDPPITEERALQLLTWMLQTVYLPGVIRLCPTVREPGLLAALVDFCYNLGVGNLQNSTLRRKLPSGDLLAIAAEMRKWNKVGGKTLRGLTLRREADVATIYLY